MKKNTKLRIRKITALTLAVMLFVLAFCGCGKKSHGGMSKEDYNKVTNVVTEPTTPKVDTSEPPTEPLPDNPINFKELKALNRDLYAWIEIPGTVINYPVAQSSKEDDNFYLHHNYLGNYEFAGTIYSQRHNTKYFIERVTILYGHNMLNGSMFAELHKFSDKEFFDKNEYIYIYINGHILTYRIFFAGEYDNRHILNSFDFTEDEVYETYLYDALHPRYANTLVRDDVSLDKDDKILILSTCTDYNSSLRFLVQGVLIDDQPTK